MDAPRHEAFFRELGTLGPTLLEALEGLEWAQRWLHPPLIGRLQERLRPLVPRLEEALARFQAVEAPDGLAGLRDDLTAGASPLRQSLRLFADDSDAFDPRAEGIARVLGAMKAHCRALEALFPLRLALPPLSRFFVEAPFRHDLDALDPEPPEGVTVGLLRAKGADSGRGGFSLYVPGSYDGSEPWPLVVALHGGSGEGRDFVWTWLREARGRRFLLLAPTSLGPTWSLMGADVDAPALRSMVAAVMDRFAVDPSRVLLTGLSDGGTYSLLCGLQEDMPFTALAPLSGVLHPVNYANGNMERAAGMRIHLTHGALDWMFPVDVARAAAAELEKAGAELVYHEIADLSHTYAREENDRILGWFDPALALPEAPAGDPGASGASR